MALRSRRVAESDFRMSCTDRYKSFALALHDTVLKRYLVAAGSARPLRDYLPLRDFSIIHDYRLPRDPSYSTILPSFTTTSALAIPLWKSLPESRAAPTIPPCSP